MSVHVVSWVLKHSETTLADRLVLIVLADHARSDGTEARPSVATICTEARLSRRQTYYCLRSLEESGAIKRTGTTNRGTTVYSVKMEGVQNVQGAEFAPVQNTHKGGADSAPEPRTEPSIEEPSAKAKGSKSTAAAEKRIFEYAQQRLGHPAWKFTSDRRSKIRARLHDGYTEQDLRSVIDGVLRDPWEQRRLHGNDDPTKVFRSGSQVDKFIELANGVNGHAPGQPGFAPRTASEREQHRAALLAQREGQR